MANYVLFARSNYFAVKDPQAFEAFCKKWRLEKIFDGEKGGDTPLYGFLDNGESGIPITYYDEAQEEDVEADVLAELATHLEEGWVAVVREIGYENMRILTGWTTAINSKGERLDLNLDKMYEDAKRLGAQVTLCEY